jgi:hypothetical protein
VTGGEAERAGSEGALSVVLSLFPLETVDGWPGLNASARALRALCREHSSREARLERCRPVDDEALRAPT